MCSPQSKANLLSPTLVNLDRIANVVVPCPVGTSGEIDSAILSTNTSPIRSTPHTDKIVVGIHDAGASTTASSTPRCRTSVSLVNDDEKLTVNYSAKLKSLRDRRPPTTTTITTTRNKTNDPLNINADDDEEIDVERVDDRDPMWRPWQRAKTCIKKLIICIPLIQIVLNLTFFKSTIALTYQEKPIFILIKMLRHQMWVF